MEMVISLVMVLMSSGSALFAGGIEQLNSSAGIGNNHEITQSRVINPARAYDSEQLEVDALAKNVLKSPDSFTWHQMANVLVRLDAIRGSLFLSGPEPERKERERFDALRQAVDKVYQGKVAQIFGEGSCTRPDQVKIEAEAVLKSPDSFTLEQMVNVLVRLDTIRGSLFLSGPEPERKERERFDALRQAVNKVFLAKTGQM